MCSAPKPKRRVNAKTGINSVSILSAINSEKRLSFADRANQASDRHIEAKQLKRDAQPQINKLVVKKPPHSQNKKAKNNKNQSWLYWLFNAPFNELMRKLVS